MSIEKNEITKPKTTTKRVPKSKMDLISNENQIQYSLFDTKQKIYESTSTLMDLRVSPFMPVDKISHNSALAKEFVANKNILKKTQSKLDIINRYKIALLKILNESKDDKELQRSNKIEFLKRVNDELSRNIFFEKHEIKVVLEELSKMENE